MSRPNGSRNKRTLAVAEAVEEEVPGFNPIVLLCEFAADESNEPEFRADCAKAAAPYLAPRLKVSEIKHGVTDGLADRVARAGRAQARLEAYKKEKKAVAAGPKEARALADPVLEREPEPNPVPEPATEAKTAAVAQRGMARERIG